MNFILFYLGLSIGEKPNMNAFFAPIVDELMSLENGQIFNFNNNQSYLKGYVLFSVFYKTARSSILNITFSNGFYGCLKCTQPGLTLKNKKLYFKLNIFTLF